MDRIRLPVQRLEAQFAAPDGDRESRTVPMVFYSGAKVMQFSWENGVHELTLSMEPAHVRLEQLQSGRAPFTLGHASPNDPASTIALLTMHESKPVRLGLMCGFRNGPRWTQF